MLTTNIEFVNFQEKLKDTKIKKFLNLLLKEKNQLIKSLGSNYKDSFLNRQIKKYKAIKDFRLIGMGGSTLGCQAIYDFLRYKIKKNFIFIDNLQAKKIKKENKKNDGSFR